MICKLENEVLMNLINDHKITGEKKSKNFSDSHGKFIFCLVPPNIQKYLFRKLKGSLIEAVPRSTRCPKNCALFCVAAVEEP